MRELLQNIVGKSMGISNYWLNNITSCFDWFANNITSCFTPFTLQDVEPTNPWLRLGGEWICKAGGNHQRSSMVRTFSFQILVLLHFAFLSFDTIQENHQRSSMVGTLTIFFTFSYCISFFWHNPSKLPQYLVLFLFNFYPFFILLFFLLKQSK